MNTPTYVRFNALCVVPLSGKCSDSMSILNLCLSRYAFTNTVLQCGYAFQASSTSTIEATASVRYRAHETLNGIPSAYTGLLFAARASH
jgi:hypothetical protein